MTRRIDPRIGRPLTAQHRERISTGLTGLPKSKEHRAAMSAHAREPLTDDHKEAIAAAKRGVPHSVAHRRAIANAHGGSAKAKSRAAMIALWGNGLHR